MGFNYSGFVILQQQRQKWLSVEVTIEHASFPVVIVQIFS